MSYQQLKKKTEGFTIIEVLIVLAIAGLILLIVFLAVPALQRNSRNTSRRNDVARVLGAAQEVINNNNGQTSQLTTANIQSAVGNLGYYQSSNVTVGTSAASDTDHVVVMVGYTCNGNAPTSGSARQMVATFMIENGGSPLAQCTAS